MPSQKNSIAKPRGRLHFYFSSANSSSHSFTEASLGILQSPLGDSVTDPTFGPSGRQLRLNCCEKKRIKVMVLLLKISQRAVPVICHTIFLIPSQMRLAMHGLFIVYRWIPSVSLTS